MGGKGGKFIASRRFDLGMAQAMNYNRFIVSKRSRPGGLTISCTVLFASSYLDYTNCILAIARFILAFRMTCRSRAGVVYQMVKPPSIMVVDPVMSGWDDQVKHKSSQSISRKSRYGGWNRFKVHHLDARVTHRKTCH